MNNHGNELLSKLEDEVFRKRPILGKNYRENSTLTLFDFSKKQSEIIREYSASIPDEIKNELIDVITSYAGRLFPGETVSSVRNQLLKYYSVITADHHGPLTDPGFLNNNLLTAIANDEFDPSILKNVIVLSSGNVSFDNDSFPRGHLFHSYKDEVLTNQLVFFPRKVRPLSVAYYPAFSINSIDEAKRRIESWLSEGTIGEEIAGKLKTILHMIYANPKVFEYELFADQVTATNYELWKELTGGNLPNLVYIEQELIVNDLLLKHHINSDTMIHKFMFDHSFLELITKHFNGISGAFDLADARGTFLFWGLPKDQKYKVQLWRKGDKLVAEDESFSVPLTKEAISEAIVNRELLPGTLLSFMVLSFYYGMILEGGGAQTTYQTRIKEACVKFFTELGLTSEAEFSKAIPTGIQAIVYPSLGFMSAPSVPFVPATTLDLLLYAEPGFPFRIDEFTRSVTVKQAIARVLPDIYRWLVDEENQNEELLKLSPEEIDRLTGFGTSVKPLGTIA